MTIEPDSALASLGFTPLESLVYCELLRSGTSTGYRLSQLIGKAPANIYQVLKALTQKGALVPAQGRDEATTYTPVPPAQLLAGLRRGFEERHDAALVALESVDQPATDENVYQLRTVTQVIERARAMLADATHVVIFDFFPPIYDLLRAEVEAARQRGVLVAGIAYRKEDVLPTMPYNGESALVLGTRWPGLGMILIVDACQYLVSQLTRDFAGVHNAVYTDSIFLSSVFHSATAADIRLVALKSDPSDPLEILSLQSCAPPGLLALKAQSRK